MHWYEVDTIDLAAASFNKRLMSIFKLIEDIKPRKGKPLVVAFDSLFQSLNPYERHLLYFISFFNPPEVPRLWLRSYLKSRSDDKEFNELEDSLQSLTKSSLLVNISGINAYQMQRQVRLFVLGVLVLNREYSRFHKNIRSFISSRNCIPSQSFIDYLRPVSKEKIRNSIKSLSFWSLRNVRGSLRRTFSRGGKKVRLFNTSIVTIEPV